MAFGLRRETGGDLIVIGDEKVAGRAVFGGHAQLVVGALPEFDRLARDRQFDPVAQLQAHIAPVPARCFLRDIVLFEQDDPRAAPGEVVRGGAADDPAADDHDIGRIRLPHYEACFMSEADSAWTGVSQWRYFATRPAVTSK